MFSFSEKNDEFIFTWRIKNYSSCFKKEGERITSPFFTVKNLCSRSKWWLSLNPKANLVDDIKFVSCFLNRKPVEGVETVETLHIKFCLELVEDYSVVQDEPSNDEFFTFSSFTKEKSSWGKKEFICIEESVRQIESWKEDTLTIRCRMTGNQQRIQKISEIEAHSTIPMERRFFEWDIKLPMLLKHSERMCFSISELYSFEIILFQSKTVFFHLKSCLNNLNRLIKFKITIYNKNGNVIISKSAEHIFSLAETWEFPDIISKDVLEVCKVDSIYSEFKMKGEICTSGGTVLNHNIERIKFRTSTGVDFAPQNCSISTMQNDIKELFNSERFSDVIIQVDGEIFHAHKFILRARLPAFADKVDQSMLENETDIADLSDEFEICIMDSFLEFIYKGITTYLNRASVEVLILAADKYNAQSLKDQCISFLKNDLDVTVAGDTYSIADSVKCKGLKAYVLSFIKLNAAKVLTQSEWAKWALEYNKLAAEILSELSTDLLQKCKKIC